MIRLALALCCGLALWAAPVQAGGLDAAWAALDAERWDEARHLAEAERDQARTPEDRFAARDLLATLSYYVDTLPVALRAAQALDHDARDTFGEDAPERLVALSILGWLQAETGDYPAAIGAVTRAIRIGRASSEPEYVIWEQMLQLADLYLSAGRARTAATLAADVHWQVAAHLGEGDPLTLEANLIRARGLVAMGYPVDAIQRATPLWGHVDTLQTDPALADLLSAYLSDLEQAAAGDDRLIDTWVAQAEERETVQRQREAEIDAGLLAFEAAIRSGFGAGAAPTDGSGPDAILARVSGLMTLEDPAAPTLFAIATTWHLTAGRSRDALRWVSRLITYPPGYLAVTQEDILPVLLDLADTLSVEGAPDRAVAIGRAALAMVSVGRDPGSPLVLQAQRDLARVLLTRGDTGEAMQLVRAGLAAVGPDPSDDWAHLMLMKADAEVTLGDLLAASVTLDDVLKERGAADLTTDVLWLETLTAMGHVQAQQGNRAQALDLLAKARALSAALFGPEARRGAIIQVQEAALLLGMGQAEAAYDLFEPALARLTEDGQGGDIVGTGLALLALELAPERELEFLQLAERGPTGADGILTAKLAEAQWRAGAPDKAAALAASVLDNPKRSARAEALAWLVQARLSLDAGQDRDALDWLRRMTDGVAAGTIADPAIALNHLPLQAAVALKLAGQSGADAPELHLLDEALAAAQWANALAARAAFDKAAERWAADGSLADLLRRKQDAENRLQTLRGQLNAGLAQGRDVAPILADVAAAQAHLQELRAAMRTQHPDFAAASDPAPVGIETLAHLLKPQEALLVYLSSDETLGADAASHVMVITRETVQTAGLPAAGALRQMAETLRCAAALSDLGCAAGGGAPGQRGVFSLAAEPRAQDAPGFDLDLAYAAYQALIEPVETALEGKTALIVVPDRAILSMPFNLLLARPAEGADPLRSAPWMLRDRSVRVMPTVSSFARLRQARGQRAPGGGFLGIGDPLIGAQRTGPLPFSCDDAGSALALSRNRAAGGETLEQLEALPDSRCELDGSARAWSGHSDLLLHDAATEDRLAALNQAGRLRDYAAITFATHGLVAGEIGAHDAGLVLTPTPGSDGLLTTTEVAALDLDADLVILSACNTAAGSGRSDEGLSGLASAFFYAGARSVMVSHWPVYSDAAVRLSSGTLTRLAAGQGRDPAEALRQTILDLLDDPEAGLREVHPSYWAPFFVAGGL